jgi:hypothetical protein
LWLINLWRGPAGKRPRHNQSNVRRLFGAKTALGRDLPSLSAGPLGQINLDPVCAFLDLVNGTSRHSTRALRCCVTGTAKGCGFGHPGQGCPWRSLRHEMLNLAWRIRQRLRPCAAMVTVTAYWPGSPKSAFVIRR